MRELPTRRARSTPSFAPSCCRSSRTWPRPAAGSTGTTTRSTEPTPASSGPLRRGPAYAAVAPLVGLEAGGLVELGGGFESGTPPTASSPLTGRTRPGSPPTASVARRTGCACSSWNGHCRPAGIEPPDAGRDRGRRHGPSARDGLGRSQQGRSSSSASTGCPFGVRPVVPISATVLRESPLGWTSIRAASRSAYARGLPSSRPTATWVECSIAEARSSGDAFTSGRCSCCQLWTLLGRATDPGRPPPGRRGPRGERARARGLLAVLGRLKSARRPRLADLVRRALVETLGRGDRLWLVALDESLLGVRLAALSGRVAHAVGADSELGTFAAGPGV